MVNRKFTVHCLYLHQGSPWPIDVEILVAAETTRGMIETLGRGLDGLAATGFVPAIGKGFVPNQQQPPPQKALKAVPHCEVHREPMIPSKYKRDDGWIGFYCPKRDPEGYCKHQAKVNPNNEADVKFWEKK